MALENLTVNWETLSIPHDGSGGNGSFDPILTYSGTSSYLPRWDYGEGTVDVGSIPASRTAASVIGSTDLTVGFCLVGRRLSIPLEGINSIDTVDLGGFAELLVTSNNLSDLSVSSLNNLSNLQCSVNNLSILDVSNLTGLETLHCYNNSISILDVSILTNLTSLWCYSNSISVLDVSNLVNLSNLQCHTSNISVLDVSNLTNLVTFQCHNNGMTAATVDQILNDVAGTLATNSRAVNIIIAGTNAPRTPASDTAVASIIAAGGTVTSS